MEKTVLVIPMAMRSVKGEMTVKEAGRKGGETTKRTHGHDFYVQIGHKGGQKVRDLIQRGKQNE
jgi:general stress protein YciG